MIEVADHREPLNVGEMPDAELGIFPCGGGISAVEAAHVEQQAQLAVLEDEPVELWHEGFIICRGQLAADMNDEQFAAVFSLNFMVMMSPLIRSGSNSWRALRTIHLAWSHLTSACRGAPT